MSVALLQSGGGKPVGRSRPKIRKTTCCGGGGFGGRSTLSMSVTVRVDRLLLPGLIYTVNRIPNIFRRVIPCAILACAALCALPWRGEAAAEYYVTPTGAGDYGGTNWGNAFSNVQDAATPATGSGDKIYLQSGVYSNASQIVISNAAGVTIYGGCNGGGAAGSNTYSGTNSTLTRISGSTNRVVYGYVSTLTMAGVTVSGGYFASGANNGAGLYFTNCAATLTNCVVRDNTNICTVTSYGGGVYANGGALTIIDSAFHNNAMRSATGSSPVYGVGVAAINCPLAIRGSTSVFSNNTATVVGNYISAYGGAVYANGAALAMDGVRLIGNGASGISAAYGYGGAVYHTGSGMSATITDCWFAANYLKGGSQDTGLGGAVCLVGAMGSIAGCTFTSNYVDGRKNLCGGGVYAGGLLTLEMFSNSFQGNWVSGSPKGGAALYVSACSNALVDRCAFDGGGLLVGTAPELLYVTNGGSAVLLNSTLRNNSAGGGLNFVGTAGSTLGLAHCVIMGNSGHGLTITNGALNLFDCLIAQNMQDGISLAAGIVGATNCTLAENGGWGFNRVGGSGTVGNSIAWGNSSGGIVSNEDVTVAYSCLQSPAYGGMSNLSSDPLFANVPNCYYLSSNGLPGQAASSPCIDTGSSTAAFWGLTNRTTRTDGTNDADTVDMGYHYTAGVSTSAIRWVTNCYVDAVNGNDSSNGLSWATAWQSLTHALSNVAANATINLATGVYNAAVGEVFPLTVQMANLTLVASHSDAALTVVDNEGTAGRRVLQAQSKGSVLLRGLTLCGGRFETGENYGAGLRFLNCAVTLTNCVVRDNTNTCTLTSYGGGLYANGGSLTIIDSGFHNNAMRSATGYAPVYGVGVAAINCPLAIRGSASVFSNNTATVVGNYISAYGGAVYANGAALAMDGVRLIGNGASGISAAYGYGGAVYHTGSGMSATITDCWFAANYLKGGSQDTGLGGAVCLVGAMGSIAGCTFTSNYVDGRKNLCGGGVYAGGLLTLDMVSNSFQGNWVSGSPKGGAALYVSACSNAVVDRCAFDGAGLLVGTAPELLYVTNGGSAVILNSTLRNNSAGGGLNFVGAANSMLDLAHCVIMGNNGHGLTISNGALNLFNCLTAQNSQDGISLAAGTVGATNCTLAENGGWGFNRAGGTATVFNSIAWGNSSGGITSNEAVVVDYSCLPDTAFGGTSNIFSDPLFANVAGCYYLSVSGLPGQAASSPCIDAGSGTAADWGLTNRTTYTSGTNDTGIVDLGYHYTNGSSDILTVSNCYVDAVNGSNAYDGLSWTSAWRTITHALTNVAANAIVNVATGIYNAGVGEVFPLTVQMPGLTLAASNTDAALTVLDNMGVSGQRVLQAQSKGTIILRGLTFRGGRFASGENYGAGLKFQSCIVTLTNCVVRDNTNICTIASYGGGVYANGGSLTILESGFNNNTIHSTSLADYGGGVAAVNCPLVIRGSTSVFSNNAATVAGSYVCAYGGAIYANEAALAMDGIRLVGNGASGLSAGLGYGGAVYHAGSGMAATITGCWFAANYLKGGAPDTGLGGAVCLEGATGAIVGCTFMSNYVSGRKNLCGGGVYAGGLLTLEMFSNSFQGNWVSGSPKGGAALYISACSNALVDRCAFDGGGVLVGTAPELLYVTNGGNAVILNSTLRNNSAGGGLSFAGGAGSATVVNCTFVTNAGWGITNAGVLTVKNSIVWDNTSGGIATNTTTTITYTDSQELHTGSGNFSQDPLFVDPVAEDYHVMSLAGSWHNGVWANDSQMSPCIDAGEPAPGSAYALEPKPNGKRVNLGAYGNTAQASRSSRGTVIAVW